jgi:hypothetical protein
MANMARASIACFAACSDYCLPSLAPASSLLEKSPQLPPTASLKKTIIIKKTSNAATCSSVEQRRKCCGVEDDGEQSTRPCALPVHVRCRLGKQLRAYCWKRADVVPPADACNLECKVSVCERSSPPHERTGRGPIRRAQQGDVATESLEVRSVQRIQGHAVQFGLRRGRLCYEAHGQWRGTSVAPLSLRCFCCHNSIIAANAPRKHTSHICFGVNDSIIHASWPYVLLVCRMRPIMMISTIDAMTSMRCTIDAMPSPRVSTPPIISQ